MTRKSALLATASVILLCLTAACLPADDPSDPLAPVAPPEPAPRTLTADDGHVLTLDREAEGGAIVDGDTVRAKGMDAAIRIVGIDTEELYRDQRDRDGAEADFVAYATRKRGKSLKPVKYGTPLGHAAKDFAIKFFGDVEQLLFIHDKDDQPRGYYGRHVGHTLVDRDGDGHFEQNFAVEMVRNGFSPYYTKYGYSEMFHDEFQAAEKEARKAKSGMWQNGPDAVGHYPDYPERLEWWHRRGETLARYKSEHGEDPSYFRMGIESDLKRLKQALAEGTSDTLTVFGTLRVPDRRNNGGGIGKISHSHQKDVALVWDPETHTDGEKEDLNTFEGEYVYVRGRAHASDSRSGIEFWISGNDAISKE